MKWAVVSAVRNEYRDDVLARFRTPDPALKEFLEKWEAGRAYDPRQSMEQFT